MEWLRDEFTVTCDPNRMDRELVSTFLASTYWAQNIPGSTVDKSMDGSMCFALLEADRQIGFLESSQIVRRLRFWQMSSFCLSIAPEGWVPGSSNAC